MFGSINKCCIRSRSKCIHSEYIVNIGGHGVGVWGCAHPPKNLKLPNTPPCQRHGGVHPSVRDPAGKNLFDTPVGLFFAKSHPCLLTKPPRRKKNFTPRWKRNLAAEGGRKIFFRHTPCVHIPLVPKPVPTYDCQCVHIICK